MGKISDWKVQIIIERKSTRSCTIYFNFEKNILKRNGTHI